MADTNSQPPAKSDTEIILERISTMLLPLAQKDPRGWWIAFTVIGAAAVVVLGFWFIGSLDYAIHEYVESEINAHANHPHADAVSRKEYQEVIRRLEAISKEQALQRQRTDRILERLTK